MKNSTILLIGIIIILIGAAIGFYEIFEEKKNKTFSEMNIKLFENEVPDNIENETNIQDTINNEKAQNNESNENNDSSDTNYNYLGILEIPKINIKRGFLDIDSKYNNVDYNITVINGSTYPDEANNNLILAAHSGICPVCYFDKLYKLEKEDLAYIYYKNEKYEYKIVNIYEVDKDGTVAIYRNYNKNTLTLITCTRNSTTKQTVYILELVK